MRGLDMNLFYMKNHSLIKIFKIKNRKNPELKDFEKDFILTLFGF